MTYQAPDLERDCMTLLKPPAWVTQGHPETSSIVAFRSGAALTVLEQPVGDSGHGVPLKLLATRLALSAATTTSKIEGRLASEADSCDAYHLTPLGEVRGPDGSV